MNKTSYWICDKCGKKIEKPEDGWVEWMVPVDDNVPEKHNFGLRIVHEVTCIYKNSECTRFNAIQADSSLKEFIGVDGLMDLLRFISDDEFENKEEVLEVIKRIHVPGYEEARNYIKDAISAGEYEPNTKANYCSQNDISHILNFIIKNKKI
ncbi:MAG: hypothetical protein E6600_04395 [Anaerocolumna aminovalerica]|uniref:hypothetical protein n=1 Tax=Anaerocolumna aminovalerica TaxID=1527 RepID=UPI00290FCC4B|nr:hypothetical protein [Anaerocolumna aminovalerica]MDU6263726.1 hypothetical protein [Anaerocolumna aminovalerica]